MTLDNEKYYIIKDLFPDNIKAGFTKPCMKGELPEDLIKVKNFICPEAEISYMKQVHGNNITRAVKGESAGSDGLVTDKKDLMIAVKTADCMPIILADTVNGYTAVVHLGWRSAAADIIKNVPINFEYSKIFIGIGLRKCCYEVGKEFELIDRFSGHLEYKGQKIFFDPVGLIKEDLTGLGARENNIYDINICSLCHSDKHHSHRRDGTKNRTISFICRS